MLTNGFNCCNMKGMAKKSIHITLSEDTLRRLQEFVRAKYGDYKLVSMVIEQAVKEFLKGQDEGQRQRNV